MAVLASIIRLYVCRLMTPARLHVPALAARQLDGPFAGGGDECGDQRTDEIFAASEGAELE